MAKSVRLSDEAYRLLLDVMRDGETASQAVHRLATTRPPPPARAALDVPPAPTSLPLGWVGELDRPKE